MTSIGERRRSQGQAAAKMAVMSRSRLRSWRGYLYLVMTLLGPLGPGNSETGSCPWGYGETMCWRKIVDLVVGLLDVEDEVVA